MCFARPYLALESPIGEPYWIYWALPLGYPGRGDSIGENIKIINHSEHINLVSRAVFEFDKKRLV